MRASDDVRLRRVGFRTGTNAELTALHAVEAPIEAERGSNVMPQPVESYIAFARSLPSQFDVHSWLAETTDGTPVALGVCWSNAAGDTRVMECDLFVCRDRRREGIGSQLLARICDETANEGGPCSRGRPSTPYRPVTRFLAGSAPGWRGSTARANCASPTSTGR